MLLSNRIYRTRVKYLTGVIFPPGRTETNEISCRWTNTEVSWRRVQGGRGTKVNTILEGAHSLCIFRSVAFIRCNGGGVKLWMRNHSVDDEDDADYSSPFPWKTLCPAEGFHTRGMRTLPNTEVSRLQAAASDSYRHLDYGLDQRFPNIWMSEIDIRASPGLCTIRFYVLWDFSQ